MSVHSCIYISLKLYTVVVYSFRMSIKENNPNLEKNKGDN